MPAVVGYIWLSWPPTTREIRRCLKRYIARELYRALTASMPVIDARGIAS